MKFRIGGQPGIVFNLPSKRLGDGGVFVGKVVADLNGLKSSAQFSFNNGELQRFCEDLKSMHQILKGRTFLLSECKRLSIELEMTAVGHVSVRYKMRKSQFDRPRNINWEASGDFVVEPGKIQAIVNAIENQS